MHGIPVIKAHLDSGFRLDLYQPFPTLPSWQWVGGNIRKEDLKDASSLTVELTVSPETVGERIEGKVFFDDLCVTFSYSRG